MNLNVQVSPKESDVHLWKYCLTKAEISTDCLSKEEQSRSARLLRVEDRERFNKVHAFFKNVLRHYIHLPPEEIQFAAGLNGKPYLRNDHLHPPVYFNLSYRGNLALLAISNSPFIGVDVELIKPISDISIFAANYFSKQERKKIAEQVTKAKQLSLVYSFWTMKEALIKSLAIGFEKPIKKYDLSSFLKEPCHKPNFDSGNSWHISRVPVEKNYRAAMAVRAEKVSCLVMAY